VLRVEGKEYVLKDGDVLHLGSGIRITVLETPGHTRDSLSFFIEPIRAAVVGEALGVIQLDGGICPEFLTDFNAYVSSAEKILAMEPSVILMPHGPSLTGDHARSFLKGAVPAAHAWKARIEEALLESGGDIDAAVQDLFGLLYDPSRIAQEMNAFRTNLRAKVACVAKSAELPT
jgi:glyoxylase-like metal-dependent hydrolase (beta-lactamase superfamily II)